MKRFLCRALAVLFVLALGAQAFAVEVLFCRKCGNKLMENSAFCNKCGTKILVERPEE